jgi:cell wall-associated NlpC family hydrolase
MTEPQERDAVVVEALTWVGTPFVWEACIKGVGVDCGRFPAAVFNAVGVKNIDIPNLPHLPSQWFMHHSDDSYLNIIKQYATEYELKPGQKPQPGDIVVAKYGRDWAHSALVIQWPKVIGAASGHCVTVWRDIYTSPQYATRQFKFLNPWGNRD